MSLTNSTVSQPILQYNYYPTEWIAIMYLGLYAVSTSIHIVQALRFRLWYLIPSAILCGFLELAGWSARLWSSQNPYLDTPYTMQTVCLIMAPTPLVAANFIILERIIVRLGPQYSRLSPKLYAIIFVCCDIISLVVQGVGGGISAGALNNPDQATLGANIALGGTSFQLAAIAAYCTLAAEFLLRYKWDKPVPRCGPVPGHVPRNRTEKRVRFMLLGMFVMTVLIVIRTIYRVIEFVDGWDGEIITTQWLFNVFDGAMITTAMYTLNVFHPGVFLPNTNTLEPTSPPRSRSSSEDGIPKDHFNMTSLVREV